MFGVWERRARCIFWIIVLMKSQIWKQGGQRNIPHQVTGPQLNVLQAKQNVPGIGRVRIYPTPSVLARMLLTSKLLFHHLEIPVQNRTERQFGTGVERRLRHGDTDWVVVVES